MGLSDIDGSRKTRKFPRTTSASSTKSRSSRREPEVRARVRRRPGDSETGGVRPRIRPEFRRLAPVLPSFHKRRASFRLHDAETGPWPLVPSEFAEFLERLPHARDSGSATGREEDPIRHAAEGLPDFEEHRLLPLHPVGFPEGRDAEGL